MHSSLHDSVCSAECELSCCVIFPAIPGWERIKHHKVVQWTHACSRAGAAVVPPQVSGSCSRRSCASGAPLRRSGYASSVVSAPQSGNWLRERAGNDCARSGNEPRQPSIGSYLTRFGGSVCPDGQRIWNRRGCSTHAAEIQSEGMRHAHSDQTSRRVCQDWR